MPDWAELNLAQAFEEFIRSGVCFCTVVSCLADTEASCALGEPLFAGLGSTIDQPHTLPSGDG